MTDLKRKKDGRYVIASKAHARAARALLDETNEEIEEWEAMPEFKECRDRAADLKTALDEWIVKTFKASEGYEDSQWKGTKVVGHTRVWNVDTLEKILPRAIFKRVVTITVNGQAIDEQVRAKKIKRKDIESAWEEKANKAHVKWTKKKADAADRAAAEAARLAEELG